MNSPHLSAEAISSTQATHLSQYMFRCINILTPLRNIYNKYAIYMPLRPSLKYCATDKQPQSQYASLKLAHATYTFMCMFMYIYYDLQLLNGCCTLERPSTGLLLFPPFRPSRAQNESAFISFCRSLRFLRTISQFELKFHLAQCAK